MLSLSQTITPLLPSTLTIPLLPFIEHPLGKHFLPFRVVIAKVFIFFCSVNFLGVFRFDFEARFCRIFNPLIFDFYLGVKGKANHPMENCHVAKFMQIQQHKLGLFSVYDGHLGDIISSYLKKHLFANILNKIGCAISFSNELGRGGSTVVTAILIDRIKLCVENLRDSRVVLSREGQAIQMTKNHEPKTERGSIENIGGFSLKSHLRSDPDIQWANIDNNTDILIPASDGLWKVMSNQEAVDIAKKFKDPQKASKQLIAEAVKRDSKDDISCVVVRFRQ
ncbi:hypothetical protein ES288_D13G106200v1 [Gossypium darwinii]|uniref:PPM-type phosphatase domain-containing protein n=1 Tax=Gossypium darwinii TaxID=34276 RepID=A0A5D2A062_GOSDA|nr:hypothetical protein ES288_D13G106200v1 [Gossypium darwinii]